MTAKEVGVSTNLEKWSWNKEKIALYDCGEIPFPWKTVKWPLLYNIDNPTSFVVKYAEEIVGLGIEIKSLF